MSNSGAGLALDSWEAFLAAHRELFRIFSEEENLWIEVSMKEYDVLYTLAKADEPLRLCDLSDGVLLSQPALSRMVDRLIDRGFLLKDPDPDDKRATRLSLTERGAELQREIGWGHGKSIYQELRSRLTPEEQRELRRLCEKLVAPLADGEDDEEGENS